MRAVTPENQRSILVADDDFDTVEMTQLVLENYGFEVWPAYSGPEAIAVAHNYVPNNILLDVALPVINGFEVARALRGSKTFSDTLIVGYSGYAGAEYYEKARDAGMDFYLPKPADSELLVACLQPELHPALLVENVVVTNEALRAMSTALLAKAQALSVRSAEAIKRAKEIVRKHVKPESFTPPPLANILVSLIAQQVRQPL